MSQSADAGLLDDVQLVLCADHAVRSGELPGQDDGGPERVYERV